MAWAIENTSDTSIKTRTGGISSYSKTFSYRFGIHLAAMILNNSDNLSKTFQATQLSAVGAQRIARNTVSKLESIHSDQNFNLFYEKVKKFRHNHDVDEPSLPRKRKPRMTIENCFSTIESDHPETPEDEYRRRHFEAIDLVVSCIKNRFDQDGFEMYALCEQLLVIAANKESFATEFEKITNFYADDFKLNALETRLKTLPFTLILGASNAETFRDVLKQVKGLSKGQKLLIGEVVKLLKLVIVMLATNAVSERSFTAMRHRYTYLRTNMSQNRLNNMMVLHVHKEKTDTLKLVNVANKFVFGSEH